MRHAKLSSIELPDFGAPTVEPLLGQEIYVRRHLQLVARMAASELDALVIYGDREHVANISWATGFDPRFEEAIYIVVPGHSPTLLAGNECLPYSETANGDFKRVLWQPLSLMGQPRDKYRELLEILEEAGVKAGMRMHARHDRSRAELAAACGESGDLASEPLLRLARIESECLFNFHLQDCSMFCKGVKR